jgi:hypothetical protein
MVKPLVMRNEEESGISSTADSSWRAVLVSDDDHTNSRVWVWMVHSVMVTADPPPETVAIVVEDDGEGGASTILAQNLVSQALMYRSVRKVFVIVAVAAAGGSREDDQKCGTQWGDTPVAVECVVLHSGETTSLPFQRGEVNVAIVLPRLETSMHGDIGDADDDVDTDDLGGPLSPKFWFKYLSPEGVFSTVFGWTYPLDHPAAPGGQATRFDAVDSVEEAGYKRIIDYDIPLTPTASPRTRTTYPPINVGVAFKVDYAIAHWRMNEAEYQVRLRQLLVDTHPTIFDGATMTSLQFAPKHSALGYCSYVDSYDEDGPGDGMTWFEECEHGHGYDPEIPAIPLNELYVSRSKAVENAGRGVFANVDIPAKSYVGLETTVYSIHMEWPTTALHEEMLDHFVDTIPNLDGTIVSVYAEAYGYASEPWGVSQDTVMSHFLTFTNHGCNSTVNIGESFPDLNEFTVDLDAPIPDELSQSVSEPYNPFFDRDYVKHLTACSASTDIAKGDELYDNYMTFGGDEHFKEMILTLRKECSGLPGMVERYQNSDGNENLSSLFDTKFADPDGSSEVSPSRRVFDGTTAEL